MASYYAGAGDGRVYYESSDWDASHDSSVGDVYYTTSSSTIGIGYSSAYIIYRVFLPVDTSGIDDGATISSANFYLYIYYKNDADNDGNDWLNLVGQTSQASPTSLTQQDFDQCGSIDNPTEGATRIDIGDIGTSSYSIFQLNSTGLSWIKKLVADPYTKLGIREGHDCIDEPSPYDTNASCFMSEDTNGSRDPYLDVTVANYTAEDYKDANNVICCRVYQRNA